MSKKTFREHSRGDWVTSDDGEDKPNRDQLKLGCLQRIADATEKMAKNHTQLIADCDWYKARYKEEYASAKRLARSNAALRGLLKRRKAA